MNESYTVKTLSPLRKIIATRLTEVTRTVPHFRLVAEVELDALLSWRKKLQLESSEIRLSVNDLIVKACATALMEVPLVNIQWIGNEIHQYRTADIAIVTAVEGGVLTPIVRSAESKSVWQIAGEIKELSSRALANTLSMDEIIGGSFTISNLGMHGVDQFDAIINAPQCAILAIGRGKPQCVASVDGTLRTATVMRATLSVDHRAIDGVGGATFMAAFRQRVEHPSDWC